MDTRHSFLDSIASSWSELASSSPMPKILQKTKDSLTRKLIAQGLPTTRQEDWKYTSLRSLFEVYPQFITHTDAYSSKLHKDSYVDTSDANYMILLVDGIPIHCPSSYPFTVTKDPESNPGLTASWTQNWYEGRSLDQWFGALNASLAPKSLLISIPEGSLIDRPIHIRHLITGQSSSRAVLPRVFLSVGKNSQARIFEEFVHLSTNHHKVSSWVCPLTQIHVGDNAHLGYYRNANGNTFHTGNVEATLERNARMESFSLVSDIDLGRVDWDITYQGENAECILDGLYLVRDKEHVDHHTTVEHKVGHCRTHQLYKGIVAHKGKAVFNGKIFIRPDAQGSEAYQTNKNLLLSTEAEVDTKPQLEIDADDVKASHGAAIGHIDPNELFYLQSRCIGQNEAISMLCRGFADEVIMRLQDQDAQKFLHTTVAEWFQRFAIEDAQS